MARRTLATAPWNHLMPRTVARTLPRSIRRAIAGVRRPLRHAERAILWHFGGTAPARRHAQHHQTHNGAVTLHGANIGQNARAEESV
jgi:4-amino-4-deoxy-L-arabinose transferase-like glycosyltransferase